MAQAKKKTATKTAKKCTSSKGSSRCGKCQKSQQSQKSNTFFIVSMSFLAATLLFANLLMINA